MSILGQLLIFLLRQYNINYIQSDPLQQKENPDKRQIQKGKATKNMAIDRTGAPPCTWLLYMVYILYILNRL